jgi:hypothetical protein
MEHRFITMSQLRAVTSCFFEVHFNIIISSALCLLHTPSYVRGVWQPVWAAVPPTHRLTGPQSAPPPPKKISIILPATLYCTCEATGVGGVAVV